MENEFIFVYGTLRKETASEMYHVLARHCEYLSDGYMLGKLYDVGGYPGATESDSPDEKVLGEVYRILDCHEVLPRLDEYEECSDNFPSPHEYIRKKVPVSLPNGLSVMSWVYIFNRDVTNLLQIKSGDYLNYLEGAEQ